MALAGGGITPTGNISITANGDYDVTHFATAGVAVPIPNPNVAFIDVTYQSGGTVTCTNGVTTLTSDTSGSYIFALDATGNWTLSVGNKAKIINAAYGSVYYVAMFNALPDTDRSNNNVLAEAYVADFNERSTDWGNWNLQNTTYISVENNALRMASYGKAYYTLSTTNQNFTIYSVLNRYASGGSSPRLVDVLNSFSSGNEQMFFIDNSGNIAYSSYLDDTSIPSSNPNDKHAYAISLNGTTMKARFYL